MVDQLLTLARLDPTSEKSKLSSFEVDLGELAGKVIARLAPHALAKEIDIGLIETASSRVQGDPQLLDLMISNLVDNAIRYSPGHTTIDVRIYRTNACPVVTVEDHGPGIPENERKRVFERFVRLAGAETDGSGIGLAIVEKIASLHQARVQLETPLTHSGLIAKVIFETNPGYR